MFVVDQVDTETREFDESKVMLGFDTIEDAELKLFTQLRSRVAGFRKDNRS